MTRSRRQLTAMLLLVVVIFALLPIPHFSFLPQTGKDRSRPFPCQDRPCGCHSAEQCKKKCCCFSAEQKLAWAKRNGVKASDVVASAKCETETVAVPTRKSCCTSRRVDESRVQDPNRSAKPETKATPRLSVVIGVIAQECQGVAQTAFGQCVFLIPPTISLDPLVEPTGERFILQGTRFLQFIAEPPVPPPRLISA